MLKLAFVSSAPSPYQVKLCKELNVYIESDFLFYVPIERLRPTWWKIPLYSRCKILKYNIFSFKGKYLNLSLINELNKINPDVLMLGGASIPSNYLAYRWAKKKGKKTIIFTEISRNKRGEIRKYSFVWKVLRYLYKDVDYIFTSSSDATKQFKSAFGFKDKVITSRYASDLDSHLKHPLRVPKDGYTYLFANRLIDIYDPILAIDIFHEIFNESPSSLLLMNNQGVLKKDCLMKIKEYNLCDNVLFLSEIKSWDDLHLVYQKSDILLLPANFSNGNFSINEAMASGMGIVVSTMVNGHKDMLKHEENCFITSPNKADFISEIKKYIDNPSLFQTHGIMNKKLSSPLSVKGTAEFISAQLKSIVK